MISTRSQKGKQKVIYISSSSSDDDDQESEEKEDVTEESDAESTDDQESDSDSDSDDGELSSGDDGGSESDYADGDGDDEEEEEEEEEEDGPREGKRSDEEIYNKIIDLIQRRRSLNTLRLEECKIYLRKHHLRLSGAKETCIERILEHSRVKDGDAKKIYPWESFSINCTGDVCTGDVVRFKQRVYEKFDKATRGGGGKILGKRTIAGRVVKESYGAAKQQHTFTVEVLWSKGVKPLAPLVPLLVKGRNLYRMKTFRQRWSNETERSKVLTEKHKRGAAARHTRAIAKSRSSNLGPGSKRNISSSTRSPPEKRRKKDPRPVTRAPPEKKRRKKDPRPVTRAPPEKRRKKDPRPATIKKKNTPGAKSSSTAPSKVKPFTHSRYTESSETVAHTQALLPKPIPYGNLLPRRNWTAENGHVDHPQMITPYNYHYAHMDLQRRKDTFTSHNSFNHIASYTLSATGAYNHIPNTGYYVKHPHPNPTTPWFEDPRNPRYAGPGHFSGGPYSR